MKNYFKKHKLSLIVLLAALVLILVSSFCASITQSAGFTVKTTDLRDAKYEATVKNKYGDELSLKGTVASGILFVPNKASAEHKLPAVALTHGYLNNRELQLQNAIELARRGFIVLTIDRGGHGNNEPTTNTSAMMNTSGLYEAIQYLACMPEVDVSKIGVSGHSMGGYTTCTVLMNDAYLGADKLVGANGKPTGKNMGLVSAGLAQGWSSFMGAGSDVSVGLLKGKDDEFFFQSQLADGTPSISRQYLHSKAAASFVGVTGYGNAADSINIENGGIYIGGAVTNIEGGKAAASPFRVVYEADEIHPVNHFSVESAKYVSNFFYTAFGTPDGYNYIAEGGQIWWVKEAFSFLGLVGFFALVLPVADLLLSIPFFANLRRKQAEELGAAMLPELENSAMAVEGGENGATVVANVKGATRKYAVGSLLASADNAPALSGVRKNITYWILGIICTLFSGFSIYWLRSSDGWLNGFGKLFTVQNTYFPQDTTGWVATWAAMCGLFALLATGVAWLVNHIINRVKYGAEYAVHDEHPLGVAKIEGGVASFLKTVLLGAVIVALLYAIVFANWGIWHVDFRLWTLDVKVFEIEVMLPTMLRYSLIFFIFYACNGILNQGYRTKNLPEVATIAINSLFNVFGIFLVIVIQYGTFRSTGVMWQPDMNLNYIVLFPIIPVLVVATILSRRLYERTGNVWLGVIVNTLLFTIITVANTAASYPYVGFFA